MKRYLIIVVVILSIIGCKTPLKVTDNQEIKVNDQTQVDTNENLVSKSELEVNISKTIDESESVVTTTKTVEYDTEKPIDSTTGKYPIKSETETSQTINRGKKTQEESSTAASDTTSYHAEDNSKKDVRVDAEQKHKERKQLPNIFWWAVSVVLVGVVVLIFWSRLKGWWSKISTWLKKLFHR